MANPGDPLADAIPRPSAQLRGRGKIQLLPARRSHHEAERAAHAEEPIVDDNRHLLGQPLLEAEPDQVAAGKPEQSRRADTHGHQPAARMTADPADGEDRAPLVHPAEMPPPSLPPVESGRVKKTST